MNSAPLSPSANMTTSPAYPKRLIEVDLPIKAISAHSRREKSIRQGHISTLHIWWARRPLAACRAVICAALWPDPVDDLCPQAFRDAAAVALAAFAEQVRSDTKLASLVHAHWPRWNRTNARTLRADDPASWPDMRYALLDFIADFANWDASTVPAFLDTARSLTLAAHEALGGEPGTRPLVVDPFAGGGSIPLEALRVGADAFASDLNPVAVLLNKVVLESIPKYGSQLADDVRKWGQLLREQAEAELAECYPLASDGSTPIAFLWARRILCEGPGCGIAVPLFTSPWLSKKPGRYIWLAYGGCSDGMATYSIEYAETIAPQAIVGTIRKGTATCPSCGYTTPILAVKRQLSGKRGGANDATLLALVETRTDASGRHYRRPNRADLAAVEHARSQLHQSDGIAQPPHQLINPISPGKFGSGIASPTRIGCVTFADLFTERQLLTLCTFSELVTRIENATIRTLLAFAVDRMADYNSAHSRWAAAGEFIGNTFGRQAIPIVWLFAETNPFSRASGDWDGAVEWIATFVEHEAASVGHQGSSLRNPAAQLTLPDDSANAIVTDPPYYGSILYSDLADYFYVWLKQTVGDVYPDLFDFDLIEKQDETIATPTALGRNDEKKDSDFFEKGMGAALTDNRRVLNPHGIGVVIFAHKSTSGWEALLAALIHAGWVVTASWPIDTERQGRTNSQGTAALASSVHLVCRPRETATGKLSDAIGDWRDVLTELPVRIRDWLPHLAREGVVGADAIFACLGPALEIFSRYARVEKTSGEPVPLREYLEHVWAAVSREALTMIFEDADVTGFEEDARLTAMWLWTLGASTDDGTPSADIVTAADDADDGTDAEDVGSRSAKLTGYVLEFDAARKIAQGLGTNLDQLGALVQVKGDKARLLPVRERMRVLFGKGGVEETVAQRPKRKQLPLFDTPTTDDAGVRADVGELVAPPAATTLDRVHQAMLLFAFGQGDQLRRFLVDDRVGADQQFWRLSQALSALYPAPSEEKRWVDGVLARKKALGL